MVSSAFWQTTHLSKGQHRGAVSQKALPARKHVIAFTMLDNLGVLFAASHARQKVPLKPRIFPLPNNDTRSERTELLDVKIWLFEGCKHWQIKSYPENETQLRFWWILEKKKLPLISISISITTRNLFGSWTPSRFLPEAFYTCAAVLASTVGLSSWASSYHHFVLRACPHSERAWAPRRISTVSARKGGSAATVTNWKPRQENITRR